MLLVAVRRTRTARTRNAMAQLSVGDSSRSTTCRGLLIVLSGPSGVGKGSILNEAFKHLPALSRSISVTTRPRRPGEQDGVDYFFTTPEAFQHKRENGEFLEWANYIDYSYGTPREWVMQKLSEGVDVALEIDVQGGLQIREQFPEAVLIFVEPPSEDALRERLIGRNTETVESLDRRVRAYRREKESLPKYDYAITNDRLDEAVETFCAVIKAEHARISRRICP